MPHTPSPTPSGPDSSGYDAFAMQARIMAFAWMGALVMIGVISWFVLGTALEPLNLSLLWAGAVLVAGLGMHRVVLQVGYAVAPLPLSASEADNVAAARKVWTSRLIMRFALCESIALLALAGGFLVERGGLALALLGIVVSLALMGLHAWPSATVVGRIADGLEAGGARSGLRQSFGHEVGPVREL